MSKREVFLILLIIVLLGLGLRAWAVLNIGAFWFDEVVSVVLAQKSVPEMMSYLVYENHPPLHYVLLHFWIKAFGSSEIIVWWSSIVTGLLAVVVMYFVGKGLFDKKAGLATSFLVAVSSFHVLCSTEARMYELLLLLASLSVLFFIRFLQKKELVDFFLYLFFTVCAVYTHLGALALLVCQNLFLVWWYFKKREAVRWKGWLAGQALLGVLFLPWFVFFAVNKLLNMSFDAWYFYTRKTGFFILNIFQKLIMTGNDVLLVALFFNLVFFGLFLLAILVIKKDKIVGLVVNFNDSWGVVLCLILFFIPLFGGLALSVNIPKYYIVAGVGMYLLIAFSLSNLKSRHSWLVCVFIFIILLPSNLNVILVRNSKWQELANYVENNEYLADRVVCAIHAHQLAFEYYYKGRLPVSSVLLRGEEHQDFLVNVLKYNFYPPLGKGADLSRFGEIVADTDKFYYVISNEIYLRHQREVTIWFLSHGWRVVNKKDFIDAHDAPGVLLLERIE